MTNKLFVTPQQVLVQIERMAVEHSVDSNSLIWGVPRGGVPVALALASFTGARLVGDPDEADLIVDDIYDSGKTKARFPQQQFEVLFDKRYSPWAGQWLVMPWETTPEHDDSASDAVTRLLQFIGEDPSREGLRQTPSRVLKAWGEWCSGYTLNPADILKTFEDGAQDCNEMVVQRGIPIYSTCEHHLAPFFGTATIGYIPNGKIVGLSKLYRLVDIYMRRLQVQERLVNQIADALQEHLKPKGVGVIIEARHMCMESRGIRITNSSTTTSALRGAFFDDPRARAEFMALRLK